MKKGIVIIAVILLALTLITLNAKSETKVDKRVESEMQEEGSVKVIVELKNKTDLPEVKIEHKFEDKISLEVNSSELSKLEKDSNVESITPVGIKNIFLTQSVPLINGTSTWAVKMGGFNLTGLGQTACILDTGANTSHADFLGKNATCVIDCTNINCFENCTEGDFNGHGTHVAGIIAANGTLKGVAPGAKFIPIKVCTDVGGGTASCFDDDIRAGLDWCISNSSVYNISVISISLGSATLYTNYCDYQDDPSNLTLAINNAIAKNISVIIATGNDANTTAIASPACIQNATSVGDTYDANVGGIGWTACTDLTTAADQIVCHANRNSITDLFAPGALINSTWKDGKYSQTGGTSMATPHVAGAFLLINQFKKLESNKTLLPSQIQSALNSTGKQITDSVSGRTFSRINILAAILSLDEKNPIVNLTSPSGLVSQTANISFTCNATDELQLANITLRVWNSTSGLVNETTISSSSDTYAQLQSNISLSFGTYSWNCLAADRKSNQAYAPSNFSISVGGTFTSLDSPQDNYYTNQSANNFTSTAQSYSPLTNTTFFIWNSTGSLIYNTTINISGTENQTVKNYTFALEGNYTWNFQSANNESNFSTAPSNKTFIYDTTSPNVTLVSPSNGDSSKTGTTTVTFSYNITEQNPSNCSLIISSAVQDTSTDINTSATNTLSKSLTAGTYYWNISCTDKASNIFVSETRSLVINQQTTPPVSGSPGGGGGLDANAPKTYYLTETQMSTGMSKILKANDKLKFNLSDGEVHILTVTQVYSNSTIVTIASNPIEITLDTGVLKKININNDEVYDLELMLNSIQNSQVNITVKKIQEKIPVKILVMNNTYTINNQTKSDEEKNPQEKKGIPFMPILIIVIVIISIVLLIIAGIKVFHALKREKLSQ
ncbi:Subtilisin-like serine protease [uncultured archaeon]|nr:Subtilisin-like serine protease [uncultured archaeon]